MDGEWQDQHSITPFSSKHCCIRLGRSDNRAQDSLQESKFTCIGELIGTMQELYVSFVKFTTEVQTRILMPEL